GLDASKREAAIERARELCERLGDVTRSTSALTALANIRVFRLEPRRARELAERALALTEHLDDLGIIAAAHYQMGEALYFLGELGGWREQCDRALELFGPGPYRNFWEAEYARYSSYFSVQSSALCGYADTALKQSREMLSAARRSADPAFVGLALFTEALLN